MRSFSRTRSRSAGMVFPSFARQGTTSIVRPGKSLVRPRFPGRGALAARLPAAVIQLRLHLGQRERTPFRPPLADHEPKIRRRRQLQVLRVVVLDADQYGTGLALPRNENAFALGRVENGIQVCLQLVGWNRFHAMSSVF